jgi:hypothetical protein
MARLLSMDKAAEELGGISIWTLRKHVAAGSVKVTRIGRRVLLTAEEVERIRRDGLPSLGRSRLQLMPARTDSDASSFVGLERESG